MLSDRFLVRLSEAFPDFYERVNNEAIHAAARLREEAGGDVQQALVRARMTGAGRLWVPYAKGVLPVLGRDRDAMEHFSRIVLTVDHLVGFVPPSMESARDHVVAVLRSSVDIERIQNVVGARNKKKAEGAAAATGVVATFGAIMAPITAFRQARGAIRFLPPQARLAAAGVAVAALLSVPLVAGYSAGLQAEKAARNFGEVPATGANGHGSTSSGRSYASTLP